MPLTRSSCRRLISGPQSRPSAARPECAAPRSALQRRHHLRVACAARTSTRLPAVQVCPAFCTIAFSDHRQRLLQVGVGEHDLRRLAAELQRHLHMIGRGRLGHRRAGGGGAGERDVVDAGVRRERRARLGAEAATRRSAPRAASPAWSASAATASGVRQASSAGFTTQALPAASARAHRAAEDLRRVVPRDDVAGDAVRHAHRDHRAARGVGNRLAMQLVGGAGVVLEVARACGDVTARLLDRLAGVAAFELGQLVVMLRRSTPRAWPGCGRAR